MRRHLEKQVKCSDQHDDCIIPQRGQMLTLGLLIKRKSFHLQFARLTSDTVCACMFVCIHAVALSIAHVTIKITCVHCVCVCVCVLFARPTPPAPASHKTPCGRNVGSHARTPGSGLRAKSMPHTHAHTRRKGVCVRKTRAHQHRPT